MLKNYCGQTKSAMYFIFVLSFKLDCVLNIFQTKCNQNIFLKAQYNMSEGHPGRVKLWGLPLRVFFLSLFVMIIVLA